MQDSVEETAMYVLLKDTLDSSETRRFDIYLDNALELLGKDFHVIKAKRKAWEEYLFSLDRLNGESSLLALKIVLTLLYRTIILRDREELRDLFLQKQEDYFLNEYVSRKHRIEFGVEVYKKWPNDLNKSEFKDYFIHTLEKLFIEEAKENPQYILEQFDCLNKDKNRSYIFHFLELRPIGMLEFAKAVQNERPVLLVNALSNFLYHYNTDRSRQKSVEPIRIKEASFKLYSLINDDKLEEDMNLETNLQRLIRYSYMDEPWYSDLCVRLWEIETQKTEMDKESLKNYFLISINCDKHIELIEKVHKKFSNWRDSYKTFDLTDYTVFINFTKQIDTSFKEILDDVFAKARNINLSSTIERKIIEDLEKLCWELVVWVYGKDKKLYFVLLKQFSYLSTKKNRIVKREALAKKAVDKFILEYDAFVKEDIDTATEVLGMVLKSSSWHWKEKNYIHVILDQVYFMLEAVAPENARAELYKVITEENEFYKRYDRGGPSYWRPRCKIDKNSHIFSLVEDSESQDYNVRKIVAYQSMTPPEILTKLSSDTNDYVRSEVAKNRNTPKYLLEKLSKDRNKMVIKSVGENSSTSSEVLHQICLMSDRYMLYSITRNLSLSKETLRMLGKHEDYKVRCNVAGHANTSLDTLMKLSNDNVPDIRKVVASNLKTTSEILDMLSRDQGETINKVFVDRINENGVALKRAFGSDWEKLLPTDLNKKIKIERYRNEIRQCVAENTSTGTNTLVRLLEDDEWAVANAAKKSLHNKGIEISIL